MPSPIQRHEALADLSRDHHHALVHAKRLVEHADPNTEVPAEDQVREFLTFWDTEASHHFTEEEHTLLPLYQRHTDITQDEDVQRMIKDHAWFRDEVPRLGQRLETGDGLEEVMRSIGERLRKHARFEDRELFPRIEETLTEDELALLHERSKAFRRRHRGDASIGPQRTRQP